MITLSPRTETSFPGAMPRGTPANLAPSARNHLLAALPLETCHPWLSELDLVDMPLGQVLHEPGRAQPYIYFPTTAIVSLLHVTMDGSSAESAVVGSEGIVGVSMFMGGGAYPTRRWSRVPGGVVAFGPMRSRSCSATPWSAGDCCCAMRRP
ncbi:hypothetical protein GCM10027399_08140 [Curvibacter fontanus]